MKWEKKGFTLIETVLVMGIAGLLMILAFTALPALLASQRDGKRRDDMMLFINRLKSYQANNNRGALPTPNDATGLASSVLVQGNDITYGSTDGNTWGDFYKGYFNDTFYDPDGTRYNWRIIRCEGTAGNNCSNTILTNNNGPYEGTFKSNNHTMYIVVAASCNGINAVASANSRNVAVVYHLERGHVYCANS